MRYEMKNDKLTVAVDSLGAQLVSVRDEAGAERLWTGDPAYWSGQAPVLFPIVGALREGRAKINGAWFEMGQHGFARRREFALAQRTETRVAWTLRADEETKKQYPFDFALTVAYALDGNRITTEFTVENRGAEPMPFVIGGHPGFNIPAGEDAAFEDYAIVFEKKEDQHCPAIVMGQGLIDPAATAFTLKGREIPLRHELFYRDALVFEGLNSHTVAVVNQATGHGVEMEFSQFPLLGIWSAANDGPYICLEPWTGCATRTDEGDEFAQKRGMTLLGAGEVFRRQFTVRIL